MGVIFGILAKRAQDGAKMAQKGAKMAPDRPKIAQDRPKMVQDRSKTCPRCLQERPGIVPRGADRGASKSPDELEAAQSKTERTPTIL